MKNALRAFLTELIDYAGLFPPARLDLDTAIRNYARCRQSPEAWMLGRFIVPAGQLHELGPYGDELFAPMGERLRLSVIAGGGDTADAALKGLGKEAAELGAYADLFSGVSVIEAVETRLPVDITRGLDPRSVADYLAEFTTLLSGRDLARLVLFVEVPRVGGGIRAVQAAANGIAAFCREPGRTGRFIAVRSVGLKLRCGGPSAEAFPSEERIAAVFQACRSAGVPLKCTAGLHHPFRNYDSTLRVTAHGFFNVIGAGLLAFSLPVPMGQIEACLGDEEEGHFSFSDDGFRWQHLFAGTAEVKRARRQYMTGFGSCSFDEPVEDLRKLGLLV